MASVMKFTHITVYPRQIGVTPYIRALRIAVVALPGLPVGMVVDGMAQEEILAAYPDLEADDIREALYYAAEAVREGALPFCFE